MGVGKRGQKTCREDWNVLYVHRDIYCNSCRPYLVYIVGCRGVIKLRGLVPFASNYDQFGMFTPMVCL